MSLQIRDDLADIRVEVADHRRIHFHLARFDRFLSSLSVSQRGLKRVSGIGAASAGMSPSSFARAKRLGVQRFIARVVSYP